jgi:hypothetical protein
MVGSEGSGQLRTDRPSTYVLDSETLLTVLLMRAPHHQLERRAGAITLSAKSPVNQGDKSHFCGAIQSGSPPTHGFVCVDQAVMLRPHAQGVSVFQGQEWKDASRVGGGGLSV